MHVPLFAAQCIQRRLFLLWKSSASRWVRIPRLGLLLRQVTDQAEQGNKVVSFYRLTELPAILIIDPVTGAKLRNWTGFVEAHR